MSSSQPSTPSSAPSELNAFQLRKRRISSNLKDSAVKRGKRAATEEAEEGEIREVKLDEVESIVALPLEPIAVRQAISTRTRSPETPYPIELIKAEATNIIEELLSYGVPPEYLLTLGISRSIIAIAFDTLGYYLKPHLAPLHRLIPAPPPPPSPFASPFPVSPYYNYPQLPFSQQGILESRASPNPELVELEKKRKAELIARRESTAQKKRILGKEVENLFAELSSTTESTTPTITPPPSSTPLDSLSRSTSATASRPLHLLNSTRARPKATDFEPSRYSGSSHIEECVIDLSDEEEETTIAEDSEDEETQSVQLENLLLSVPQKIKAQDIRKALQAKEAEIKQMMILLESLEKKGSSSAAVV